ncbi:MAG: hypothetical protein U9Q82_07140 [Chloroflexota bacterium]|nr:hypothetical protein [Chloroflexota bacterium]
MIYGEEIGQREAGEVTRPLICRLRQRLSAIEGGDNWIKTIRGTGYVFDADLP